MTRLFSDQIGQRKSLGFCGDEKFKYADIISGGEGMEMFIRIFGGPRKLVAVPFMVFKNKFCSYHIQGALNTAPGVCYQTRPKGWVEKQIKNLRVGESRALPHLSHGQKKGAFCGKMVEPKHDR